MDLRQLQALRAIARTGSFTLAARELNLTQSALSHQIKKLERELDQALVVRSRPRARLSPAGQRVAASAERVLAELGRLRRLFTPAQHDGAAGALRVAVTPLAIDHLYGDLYEGFIVAYPRIELILTATETPTDGVRQVVGRSADVAFAPFPLHTTSGALETVRLGRMQHVFIAAPNHPLARAGLLSAERLRGSPFIRYVPGAGARRASDQFFGRSGGYPPILTESNDTSFIKRIVRMGLGIALIPYATVRQELDAGELTELRVGAGALTQDFGLVHRRANRTRPLELFKRWCVERRDTIPGLARTRA